MYVLYKTITQQIIIGTRLRVQDVFELGWTYVLYNVCVLVRAYMCRLTFSFVFNKPRLQHPTIPSCVLMFVYFHIQPIQVTCPVHRQLL